MCQIVPRSRRTPVTVQRPRWGLEDARVARLPAAGRVEHGPRQRDPTAVAVDLGDGRVELGAVGVNREQLCLGEAGWRGVAGAPMPLCLAESVERGHVLRRSG